VIKYTIPKMVKALYPDGMVDVKERIKVIVFMPEEENQLDSRVIKYYLTEERHRNHLPVMVSDPDFILSLLNDRSSIMVLMGAEAFDSGGRVVRTSVYKKHLCDFLHRAVPILSGGSLKWEQGCDIKAVERVKTVVCAESYKKSVDLSRIMHFFDDQYDKIQLYEASLITETLDGD
jgi:hypothetical protein